MDQVNADAGKLLTQWAALDGSDAQAFLREQLDGMAQRRLELEASIVAVGEALRQVEDRGVTVAVVREALAQLHQVYAHLKPFEQRELLRLVVHRVEVRDTELVLEVKGNACSGAGQAGSTPLFRSQRFETPDWLPEQVA